MTEVERAPFVRRRRRQGRFGVAFERLDESYAFSKKM